MVPAEINAALSLMSIRRNVMRQGIIQASKRDRGCGEYHYRCLFTDCLHGPILMPSSTRVPR
jgi:hypothetical protein